MKIRPPDEPHGSRAGLSGLQLPKAHVPLSRHWLSMRIRRILRFQVSQSGPGMLCITCVA